MNILIVNCCGLGDGLIELPFIKALDEAIKPVRFFHTDGQIFQYPFLSRVSSAEECSVVVPAQWRKFHPNDWAAIGQFLTQATIDLVINFRLLGPIFDSGYFAFREQCGKRIKFFNFAFEDTRTHSLNIRNRMEELLQESNLIQHPVNALTLRILIPRTSEEIAGRIGINIQTGNVLKEWPLNKWLSLCSALLQQGHTLTVFGGYTEAENERARALTQELGAIWSGRVECVTPFDMLITLQRLEEVECLVSTDSWLLHAAAGLGIRYVGLYITTSAQIWGGNATSGRALESAHLQRCANYDSVLGICRNGYRACDLVTKDGDGIEVEDVLTNIRQIVTQP